MSEQRIRIILKNGIDFVMTCEEAEFTHNKMTGKLEKLKYIGATKNILLYLDIDQVAAALQEEIE